MTSQGSAHGRFTRALAQKNVRGAELAAKEMGGLSLIDALDYVVLLAEIRPLNAAGERLGSTEREALEALIAWSGSVYEPRTAARARRTTRR